ncbi:DNA repair protein RecN [Bacillus sp. AGMB 02131]|uniref:DNA repair protein RecN n=1 Tax=Peribacillus faecalis TaxID=2772559 RepID=A0A927HC60_9BACI|nr:DNA repair protein RecN [Peribacillus faecalis]MBD3108083.1 DNA repair protein RecN [Peribacillus faecalis]
MLVELSIKNFAIIEELSLSFTSGLTVLTGETGAGKSIIIDAINLLAGGRGSSEFVRHGETKAEIEGMFMVQGDEHPVYSKAETLGIDVTDGVIILRRDIALNGKSVCRVNGKMVTTGMLKEIGQSLIDVHGQHEHQELMDYHFHLPLLDQFGGDDIKSVYEDYEKVYEEYCLIHEQYNRLNQDERQTVHRLDFLTFQYNEIQKANLRINEDDELFEERKRINNFEKIYEGLHSAYEALRGDQKALDWLSIAKSNMEDIAAIDENAGNLSESISNSYYLLEEISLSIRNSYEMLEYDSERLNIIESRLNELNNLKRKYGKTIAEILAYYADIEEEIETLQNRETHLAKLEKQLIEKKQELLKAAIKLSNVRKDMAKVLTAQILQELKELYMEKTKFEVVFIRKPEPNQVLSHRDISKNGLDEVEFYISTNPGEPLKPLAKTASGGELSRIMLALKNIFSKHSGITSIIFDEVDTGVSGRVAQAIAEKIYKVSVDSQVLCISHLPQVAAMSDTHLYIEKETKNGRTKTSVRPLNFDDKVKEIARMISGVEITSLTKKHAEELLVQAGNIKEA